VANAKHEMKKGNSLAWQCGIDWGQYQVVVATKYNWFCWLV